MANLLTPNARLESIKEFKNPMRAVSSWSLHRTLGRFVGADSAVAGGPFMEPPASPNGIALLDLPAALRDHGYGTLQLCHFHLPSREPAYLEQFRSALAEANITLDALLIDDGDLTNGDADEAWIGSWLDTAAALGAKRARIGAGKSTPSARTLRESATRLARLAATHPDVRVVTENWWTMLPDADTVHALLEATGDSVGLLIDLGNWSGPDKYEELARIATLAESCHAKCRFNGSEPDRKDFRTSLQVLKDVGYDGPLALIYDGPDDDEWGCLDKEAVLVREIFGPEAA